MFKKQCKVCSLDISYKNQKVLDQAIKRDSMCKSCRSVMANKSEKREKKLGSKNIMWKGYKDIPYAWFSRYFEREGKRYPKTGSISIEDVYDLWIRQSKKCALSGVSIGFCDDSNRTSTCSIDRIDSLKQYDIENIQLVHKHVNIMKNKFNNEYFINMCKNISNFNK